jgi:uncharacterized membrane protein
MEKVTQSIDINAPVEEVFSYVENPDNQMDWMTSLIDVRNVSGESQDLRFEWTYKMAGVSLDGETARVQHVASKRLVSKSKGGIESTFDFVFTPSNGGTRVDLTVEYEIPIPVLGKLAEKLVAKRNAREMELNLQNIKESCET